MAAGKTKVESSSIKTRIESPSSGPTQVEGIGSYRDGVREARRYANSLPAAITAQYEYIRDLPSGGSEADTLLLRSKSDGSFVFMKYYRGMYHPNASTMRQVMNADSKHVVHTLEYHDDADGTWELQEYCALGSLKDWAKGKAGKLGRKQMRAIVIELTDAIDYLHHLGSGIAHRDLKPGNILVRSEDPLDLVLADFGIAKQQAMTHLTATIRGTWHYAAPEVHMGEASMKSDWFALGAIIFELWTGRKLFSLADGSEVSEEDARARCLRHNYSADAIEDIRWRTLVAGLTTWDKNDRWGAGEIRAWLDGQMPEVKDDAVPAKSKARAASFHYRPPWSPTLVGSPQEWIALCRGNWSSAASSLAGRPNPKLREFLEDFEDTEKAVKVLSSSDSPDAKLVKLQVLLDPESPSFFKSRPLDDVGLKATIEAADGEDEDALTWLEEVAQKGILNAYSEVSGSATAAAADFKLGEWRQQAEEACRRLPDKQAEIGRQAFRAALPALYLAALSDEAFEKHKAAVSSSAATLAKKDLGSAAWIAPLKKVVSQENNSHLGFFTVASAVLDDARKERLKELAAEYKRAQEAMRQGNYVKAREMFAALGDYSDANRQATRADNAEKKRLKDEQDRRDAEERARKDKYQRAENLIEIKQYDSAIRLFDELGYYSDARTKSNQLRMLEREYKSAKASLEKQHWTEAERFLKKLGDYRDSAVLLASISQIKARAEIEALVRGKRELEGYRDTLDEIKRLSNDGSVFGGILGLTWVFALLALGGVILGASGSSEWLVGFFPSLLFLLAWIACLVAFLVKRASAKANADRVEELRKQLPMFIPAVPETKKPNSTNTDRPMLNRKNLDEEIGTLQAKIDKLKARQLH